MQSKAVVVLLILSAVSLTFGQTNKYCMPITNPSNSVTVCGTLPASTCSATATAVDANQWSVSNYATQQANWAAKKAQICPNNPSLVDDYPVQYFCPDLCTSNYTCQANQYTTTGNPYGPMCYQLCVACFDTARCDSWAQLGNVTRSSDPSVNCYGSWTHEGKDTLQVNDVTPTWGYLKGNQKVVITGCGFTTYSEATCVWGNWHSTNALIVDDNTIHCWTPKVSFITIPTTTSFSIIFDGTPAISRKLPDFWWGPMITGIAPTQVFVSPTSPLTVSGFGFSEWTGNTTVTIDGVACTGVATTDTTLTCTLPVGSINQNAIVDVYFNGWKYNFAHTFPTTLHYGPVLTGINPTCGHVAGGDTITLTGINFDDPILNNPRVEFFWTGTGKWYVGTNAAHNGATITVTTPNPNVQGVFNAWDTFPSIEVFGGSPSYSKVPGTTQMHYGAMLFTVSPTVGYIDGGETVSITGCAFRDYNNTLIAGVYQDAATTPLCTANSWNIVSDNLITCTSVATPGPCYTTNLGVEVAFTDNNRIPTAQQKVITPKSYSNSWWWGPYIDVNSLTPTRGPWSVQSTVTVTGYKIGRNINTLFNTSSCTFNLQAGGATAITGTVGAGQTQLVCNVPANAFNTDSTVTYTFNTVCGAYPTVSPNYHWGPRCTGVSPTFGYLGGGQTVTLQGVGFQDVDWNGKVLRAQFCVNGVGAGCNWEQLGSTNVTVGTTSSATVNTPTFALSPRNGFGGNRYFGDSAAVTLYFDTDGTTHTNVSYALTCGNYRYGPIVTSTNPRKGPMGPRADHSPNTPVTVNGVGFADPLMTNNIRVAFGPIHGEGAVTGGDTTITVKTLWGARANTDKSVYVYFDTCNTTFAKTNFTWGPQVFNVTPIWGYNPGVTGGANTVVTITGARFSEWLYNGYTDAVCVIDNVYGTQTTIVNDNTITCTVPDRPFGTQAPVQVVFGKTCRGDWDWSQVVQASQDIYYRPMINAIVPTFGYTSGNVPVTIRGLGLGGWPSYTCYFGHYMGGTPSKTPVTLDDEIVCNTPTRREDFNTDVLVHVQLVAGTTYPPAANQIGFDYKVWGPTYHYGPICTSVSPSRGYLNPDPSFAVTLTGQGFKDPTWFNNSQPYVLFNGINVTVQAGASDTQVIVSGIAGDICLANKTITMWWDKPSQVISCPVFTHGPYITQSTPTLGWAGDNVIITGDLFTDPAIYNSNANVTVTFGSATGTVTNVLAQQIQVTAPTNAWLADPQIQVTWRFNKTCQLNANNFHYGPIITAIVPTFGYVWGRQPVTVQGQGFQCCGLDTTKTNCRFAHTELPTTDGVTNTVDNNNVVCVSLGRYSEVTSSSTATTTKVVGLSFNATQRIIDTDTPNLPRQSTVSYYYGPLVTNVVPTYGRIRGGTTITINGAGFDDPYFNFPGTTGLMPACKFVPQGSTTTSWAINATTVTKNTVECKTLDYIHKCGDPVDVITLSFYVNTSTTDRFVTPTDARLTHYYGPVITSVVPSWGYVKGGDTVTITANELDEWTGRKVRVLFGNRETNNAAGDFTIQSTTTQITVNSPRGSFLHTGPVGVILDYKNDALTTLQYYWHWHPYTTSISQAWGIEAGGFQTTVYGGGFCEYELVTCSFGTTLGRQSDVAYDDRIVCNVPTNAPSSNAIALTFCDYWADCQASYAGSADTISTAAAFTHVGITGVAPVSGPWVGNTIVTITGTGFDQFSAISVAFGSLTPVSPTGNATATSFTVVTPASPTSQTVQIFITLTYTFSDGVTTTFTIPGRSQTPFNFFYGYPNINSIAPTTTDVDIGTDVTLTGDYFNGGVLANIKCFWTVAATTGTSTLSVAAKAKTDTTVTCASPIYTNGVAFLGPSTVSVSFDGARKSNIVGFQYSQTAAVTSITPTSGPQYGATSVTIFGNNFNAGISVLCKFDTVLTGAISVSYNTGSTTSATTATATTGATNTTTGGSTTGATNTTTTATASTTTTGGKNTTNGTVVGTRYEGGRQVRGTADQIVCYSPRSLANTFPTTVRVEISLDGGLTWTTTTNGLNVFTYQSGFTSTSESATQGATSATSMANAIVPLVSMIFALVLLVVVF